MNQSFAPIINYFVDYNASILVDVITNEFIAYKKTTKDTDKLIYTIVQDRFWTIIKYLTMDPTNDTKYGKYFEKNKWNSIVLQQKLCKAIIERCLSYDVQNYQEEKDNFETIGAFIGLASKHYPKHKYDAFRFIENCVNYNIHTALICMIHLNELNMKTIKQLLEKYQTLNSKDKFMLLDTIKLVNNIKKKSITYDEAINLCEINKIIIQNEIMEIKNDIKKLDEINYEEKAYNIITGILNLKEDDNIIINDVECSPPCIDDAYYSLTKLKKMDNYSDEKMLYHMLLAGIRTFKKHYYIEKMMIFCKNIFKDCNEICQKYEMDTLDEAINENPMMTSILPLAN
jgi:hypothetical protein